MRTRSFLAGIGLALVLTVGGGVAIASPRSVSNDPNSTTNTTPTQTILGFQGTAWLAETPAKLAMFRHYGWGTAVRRKSTAPADQWIHMPLTAITLLNGYQPQASWITFCAQSTNSATKPVRVDLWENNDRFQSVSAIPWGYGTGYGCYVLGVTPQHNVDALGISVLLHFAHAADTITLYDISLGYVTP